MEKDFFSDNCSVDSNEIKKQIHKIGYLPHVAGLFLLQGILGVLLQVPEQSGTRASGLCQKEKEISTWNLKL